MATRSWTSIISEIDPEFSARSKRHTAYEFSNGRRFEDNAGSDQFVQYLRDIALTDRADGSLWALQNDAAGHIKIVNQVPAGFVGDTYPAFDGPVIETQAGPVRLLVRGARLGYEAVTIGNPIDVLAPDQTHALYDDTIYRVQAPVGFTPGQMLSYETAPELP